MEGMTAYFTILKDLRDQMRRLTLTIPSLTILFNQEANRLNRKDQVSQLRALRSTISQQLDEVKSSEDAARSDYEKAKAISSLGRLVAGGVIKMTAQNKQMSAYANNLLKNRAGEDRPFGTVLVGIGPKGLPGDVGVASISQIARESNQEESEIIHGLKEHGYLLFCEKPFLALIDKLIEGVQEGRLVLPIVTEKLSEIITSGWLTVKSGNSEWVRYYGPI